MWEYSLSLRRWPVAGLPEALNNCLVPAFFTPQALWEMKWRSAEVGAAFSVCACMSLRKRTLASPSSLYLNAQESGECPASGWLWGCYEGRQPRGGAAYTPARTPGLIWFCRQPACIFQDALAIAG